MGFPRAFLRAAVAAVSASALVASGLVLAESAAADPANPTPVSGTALPTAQVNGVVWTQAVANGIDYVGGSFTQSQPAGAAAGVDVTSRSNLFAYNVSTGAALAGFDATTNAQVRGIAASADGSVIYIAGDFTTVDGQPRNRIAALDPEGDLIPSFAPNVNGRVYSVMTRGDTVYLGGTFTAVDGVTRSKAAAVTTSGGLLPFAPTVDGGTVRALAMSPDGRKVLLGGNFVSFRGVEHRGLAAVDSTSGAIETWGANKVVTDAGTDSAIFSLSTRGDVVYATGYVYGQGGNLEGAVAMNWADGSIVWLEDCHGDSYSSVPFNDALYVVSHAHDCSNVVGGWSSPGAPSQWRRAQAFSQSAVGVLKHNTEPAYYDFGGLPSPELVPGWSPSINTGTFTGENQGAWSAAAGDGYLVLGGEFTKVNDQRQTGLVRFQGQVDPADGGLTPPPVTAPIARPAKVSKPSVASLGPTAVAVRWSAPKGATADEVSGYIARAYKGSKLVKTVSVGATKRLATISGLKRSTTYRIGVTAKNAKGSGTQSTLASVKTKATGKNVSATKHPSKVGKPSTSAGKAKVKVRWKAASAKGALSVTKYQIRFVKGGKTVKVVTVNAKARSKTVTRLSRGSTYHVSVRAANWAGWGSWSTARSVRIK